MPLSLGTYVYIYDALLFHIELSVMMNISYDLFVIVIYVSKCGFSKRSKVYILIK